MSLTYKQSGVDIDAGDALVERIKPLAAKTRRPELLSGVGGFGGLFAIPPGKYKEPILVSGTDGVGTKLKLAFELDHHDTVGIDLVAMSVNDVITSGAEPLFFLDYYATSKLNVEQATRVIAGIARGCELAGCSLLGGETAEVPGFYQPGDYELAGFCVGIVERIQIIDGSKISPGNVVIGITSAGLHSNGYSLARKIVEHSKLDLNSKPAELEVTLGQALLAPTTIYVKALLQLLKTVPVHGLAHITGSGIPGNLPRCMPQGTQAVLSESKWRKPAVFDILQRAGNVARDEMFSTFNMGLGMVAIVSADHADETIRLLAQEGLEAWNVGGIEKSPSQLAEPVVIIQP